MVETTQALTNGKSASGLLIADFRGPCCCFTKISRFFSIFNSRVCENKQKHFPHFFRFVTFWFVKWYVYCVRWSPHQTSLYLCIRVFPTFRILYFIFTLDFSTLLFKIIVLQLIYNFNARLALRILRIPITWRVYSRRPSVGFCQRALRFIVPVLRPLGTSDGSPLRIRCVSPKYQLNALRTPTNRDTSAFTLFWTNSCAKLSYQHC